MEVFTIYTALENRGRKKLSDEGCMIKPAVNCKENLFKPKY
jgi:hypothetical protein